MKAATVITTLILLALLLQASHPNASLPNPLRITNATLSDPLGHFEGTGQTVPITWTGDGQVLSNPSFDTGLTPWISTSYNAGNRSSIQQTSPGYGDGFSARILLFSRNLTIGSNLNLLQDLSKSQIGFNSATRFRAAVFVQNVSGATSLDRVEIALLLSTSLGNQRTIHYVFNSGTVPPNTPTDVYIRAPGYNTIGTWLSVDTSLASDASYFVDSETIDSIQQVSLSSMAQTFGRPNHDPHLRYYDNDTNGVWSSTLGGEPIVYDANLDGMYEQGTDTILVCVQFPCPVTNGVVLKDDPLIKYVDTNANGVWDTGESIIYDKQATGGTNGMNDNIFEFGESIIYGPTPNYNTFVMTPIVEGTNALFDRVELFTASGGTDWVHNGGFENGMTGWGYNASFISSSSTFHSGSFSARGTVTNGGGEMAQSIDARPQIDSSLVFKASTNIFTMAGSTSRDVVDVWLGLVDSKFNPASVHYYFKTGDGTIPSNKTDITYHKAPVFGGTNQWLSLNVPLIQEEARFNGLGFTPPYNVEAVVVEIGAFGSSSTTTAYFDELSLFRPGYSGSAQAYFYADSGRNSTYVYTASNVPQGSLSIQLPASMKILNITAPEGITLPPGAYTNSTTPTTLTVIIPPSTFFTHSPLGTWKTYTTSTNAETSITAQDPNTMAVLTTFAAGSTVNLVSQSSDPLGVPSPLASVNITLWNGGGVPVAYWAGTTNSQGLWTVAGVTLPPVGNPAGTYTLQATVTGPYVGIMTTQLAITLVLAQVIVSLAVSSGSISEGTPVTISGTVVNAATGTPRIGTTVTVAYHLGGDCQNCWHNITTTTTDSSGHYSYAWTPPQGAYQVRATVGDPQTATTQSSPSQIIVGPPGQNPTPTSFPWVFVLLGAVAAATITIALLFLVRKRPNTNPTSSPR